MQRAGSWASVLGTGLAIIGALVTLVTWRSRQRAAVREPARVDQVRLRREHGRALLGDLHADAGCVRLILRSPHGTVVLRGFPTGAAITEAGPPHW